MYIKIYCMQACKVFSLQAISHHALSLKEMGAVPGGAFRTF